MNGVRRLVDERSKVNGAFFFILTDIDVGDREVPRVRIAKLAQRNRLTGGVSLHKNLVFQQNEKLGAEDETSELPSFICNWVPAVVVALIGQHVAKVLNG